MQGHRTVNPKWKSGISLLSKIDKKRKALRLKLKILSLDYRKVYMKVFMKAYRQTPKGKAYLKAYRQTPKQKAYMKAYMKVYMKAYNLKRNQKFKV
mgnify:FL=1